VEDEETFSRASRIPFHLQWSYKLPPSILLPLMLEMNRTFISSPMHSQNFVMHQSSCYRKQTPPKLKKKKKIHQLHLDVYQLSS